MSKYYKNIKCMTWHFCLCLLRTCEKHTEHMDQLDSEMEQHIQRMETRIRQEVCFNTHLGLLVLIQLKHAGQFIGLGLLPLVRTDWPDHSCWMRISLLIKTIQPDWSNPQSMHDGFSAKTLWRNLFHCQHNWSGHGPAAHAVLTFGMFP